MLYVSQNSLKVTSTIDLPQIDLGEKVSLIYDSEFTFRDKLTVDSIQFYIPEILPEYGLVYPYENLTKSFTPWFTPLTDLGVSVQSLTEDEIQDLACGIAGIYNELTLDISSPKQYRSIATEAINKGLFDTVLEQFSITRESLKYNWNRNDKEGEIIIVFPELTFQLKGFFADVDLFKCIGQDSKDLILESSLESTRVLRFRNGNKLQLPYTYINGTLTECYLELRDVLSRFPVLSGNGLDNQCKVYQADVAKISIANSVQSKELIGLTDTQIKENMSLLRQLEPTLFYSYGAVDTFATEALSQKHQLLLDAIRSDFGLEIVDVKDTAGSNVGRFLSDLYVKHFAENSKITLTDIIENSRGNISERVLSSEQIVTKCRKAGTLDTLTKLELNQFGLQTFRTVGGLLYSRMSRVPSLTGTFGDLDETSCYSTKLSNINIYLGTPVILTFKLRKSKPKLSEVINFLESNCPRDGWFVRVSGKFSEVVNTLILSDLRFVNKREKFNTIWDKRLSSKSIQEFNAFKTAPKDAQSTLLTKEIKFGLITADLWSVIKVYPEVWVNEFEGLSVDAMCYIPNGLICDDLETYVSQYGEMPTESYVEKFDPKTGLKNIETIYCRDNLVLRFPASQYYERLKSQRSLYKKAGNPIQEVYKLVSNSSYGALACEHLGCNNLLAANIITGGARATTFLMMNALNGFQCITDGATFNWESIPLGMSFKDICTDFPEYLIHYDSKVSSEIDVTPDNAQQWIDDNFKSHLYSFYGVDNTHIPANLYGFELKEEMFNGSKTPLFNVFINHGSGSYIKGVDDDLQLFEDGDFDLSEGATFAKLKARSFKGSDSSLMNWYVNSLTVEYCQPPIYSERQIIKFGLGNVLAIKYLGLSDKSSIAHPMGFVQTNYKLMKLVTRSQFLFQSETQLRNFERNLTKLDILARVACGNGFWDTFNHPEMIEGYDYRAYLKTHGIGLGLEFLALNRKHKGSIKSVRNLVADKVDKGVKDFNATFNLDKSLSLGVKFAELFGELVVLRVASEHRLLKQLEQSANEPTVLSVTKEDVRKLEDLIIFESDID